MNAAPTAAPEFRMAIQIDKNFCQKSCLKPILKMTPVQTVMRGYFFMGSSAGFWAGFSAGFLTGYFFNWTTHSSEMSVLIMYSRQLHSGDPSGDGAGGTVSDEPHRDVVYPGEQKLGREECQQNHCIANKVENPHIGLSAVK